MAPRFSICSFALLAASLTVYATDGPPAGRGILLSVTGRVSVAGSPALAGATVSPGDVIDTAVDSAARVGLGPHSTATLLPDTQLVLPDRQHDQLQLKHGSIQVRQGAGNGFRVQIAGAWVLIRADGATQAMCDLASAGSLSQISLQQGVVEIHPPNHAPVFLHAGEWARLDASGAPGHGAPPQEASATNAAGTVTRQMPKGSVDRQGQQNIPLRLNDPVEWNDVVHTLGPGRMQITLTDGSVLSVGSRSEMRIVKHDADSQQTEIEMTVGKMRADVQPITKPGGKFQVRTKTAVIGVVGTTFVVDADGKQTKICGVSGETTVSSTDPNNPGTVTLHKGECVVVYFGGMPSAPAPSASELASMMTETTVNGATAGAAGAAAGAGAGAAAGAGISTTVIVLGAGLAIGGVIGGLAAAGSFSGGSTTPPVSVP